MALFRHPHLTRGLVKTAQGAFSISRGVVDVPDEIGESLGWRPVHSGDDEPSDRPAVSQQTRQTEPSSGTQGPEPALRPRG